MSAVRRILLFSCIGFGGYFLGRYHAGNINLARRNDETRNEADDLQDAEGVDRDLMRRLSESNQPAEIDNSTDVFGTCRLTIVQDPFYRRTGLRVRYSDPIACCNKSYSPGAILHNGRISVNKKRAKEFSYCRGRCHRYVNPFRTNASEWVNITRNLRVDCDFFKTECFSKADPKVAIDHWMHMQVVENDESTVEVEKQKKDRIQPDVLLMVFDSVGSAQARRSLPRTLAYLETKMQGRNYWNLNKVGINTNPNAYAMLLGWRIYGPKRGSMGGDNLGPEHPEHTKVYLDNTTAIFKQYEKYGYKTLYSDDYTFGTPFTYPNGKGFKTQETNHIFGPLVSTTRWDQKLTDYMNTDNCYERYLYQLRYTEMFMNSYDEKPKMVVQWNSGLAHDHPYLLYHSDEKFLDFFRGNRERLDNAFIIMIGDHGPRFGGLVSTEIGPRESKNPLLHITVPRKLRKNRELKKVMEENSVRLVTQYDVYATMVDILKYLPESDFTDFTHREVIEGTNENNGTSLLREFSEKYAKRSCRNIPIDSTHCLCEYDMDRVTDKKLFKPAGAAIADEINRMLKENNITDKCAKVTYEKMKKMMVFIPAEVTNLYTASVYLKPSMGLFKTVLKLNENGEFTCEGDIVRLNEYRREADCIATDFPALRPYCYCKD